MIQRIQSLYLLAAGGLMLPALFMTLMILDTPSGSWLLDAVAIAPEAGEAAVTMPTNLPQSWGLFAVGAVACLLPIIDIFLYKHRVLQMRIASYTILLLIGFCGYLGWLSYEVSHILEASLRPSMVAALPLISIIFCLMAIRGIGADEVLVRSLDRIR